MIVVSMTSWARRINNVVPVLNSLADVNSYCERSLTTVELNLSEEEFPKKEKDLPNELLFWKSPTADMSLSINWVGRNTKAFKKLIPTVKKYYDKDVKIITVDDDVLYPKGFLASMEAAADANPEHIISNNFCRGMYQGQQCVNGAGTLYRPRFFTPFLWEELTDDIIATNADDWWYSFCLCITGIRPVKYIPQKLKFFNEVNPNESSAMDPRPALQRKWLEVIHRPEVSGGAGRCG
jgi:hypothetical protein